MTNKVSGNNSYRNVFFLSGRAMISTGLQVELPLGYYGRVAPRSSLAAKHSIDVGAGVVDSDYRGELKVILFNFSDQDFEVIYLFLLLLFFFFAKIVLNEQLQFWYRVVFVVLIEAHILPFENFLILRNFCRSTSATASHS